MSGQVLKFEKTEKEIAWYMERIMDGKYKCDVIVDAGNLVSLRNNPEMNKEPVNIVLVCLHFDRFVCVDDIISQKIQHQGDSLLGVVTDNFYTPQAEYYAKKNNILLINKSQLATLETFQTLVEVEIDMFLERAKKK